MQRQELIRHIITHLPAGSFKGLDAKGQQVVQLHDQQKRTQTYATLEMLSEERLCEIAEMQFSEAS